jgi:hypothetical protein
MGFMKRLERKPKFSAVAKVVDFALKTQKMLYLSMRID